MATPNDMRVSAEHIALADQFVEVPGGSNNNNYANVSLWAWMGCLSPLHPPVLCPLPHLLGLPEAGAARMDGAGTRAALSSALST